jgi:cell division protein FtsN
MAKLTSRDYKSSQRSSLDVSRYKEFGWGVATGACIASVAFLYFNARAHRLAEQADVPHPDPHHVARSAPDSSEPGAAKPAEKYDFYQMLPNFEVVVPEKEKDVKRDLPATSKVERPGIYVLQVGSYRSEPEADGMRARLSKLGVDAKVQRVAVDADVWHRVRIGPINNLDELNKVRKQLQGADVDAIVIRIGD